MPVCIVKNCRTNWRRKDENIILHSFPKNLERIKVWLQQTGQFVEVLDNAAQRILDGKVYDTYRMCSKHFTPDCYSNTGKRKSLNKTAIPTLFPSDIKISYPNSSRHRKTIVEDDQSLSSSDCPSEGPSTYITTNQNVTNTFVHESLNICSTVEVSESLHDTVVEEKPKVSCQHKDKSTASKNIFMKPYIRTRETRCTSVDPLMWMSNKRVGTRRIKTNVKATQAGVFTREVGVQCSLPTFVSRITQPSENLNDPAQCRVIFMNNTGSPYPKHGRKYKAAYLICEHTNAD